MAENQLYLNNDEKVIWSHEATCDLIHLYRQYPVLYAPFNSDYKNKGKRLEALKAIRTEMIKKGRKPGIEDIKRKIHGLRTQYANQLSKMKRNEEARPTLWCFNQLDFLRINYESQGEPDNESKDMGQFQFNVNEHNDVDDSNEMSSFYDDIATVKQEVTPTNSITEMPPAFISVPDVTKSERGDDDIKTFGRLVELELRKITNPQALRKAKKEIIGILMDAQEASD